MNLKRFQALAASLGADISRWPAPERAEAQGLLESCAQARSLFEQASQLDQHIAEASAAEDAMHWQGGASEQRAALADLRTNVLTRIAELPQVRSRGGLQRLRTGLAVPIWTLFGTPRAVGFATSSAIAVLLGLLIGWIQTSVPASPDVLTLLEASPFRLLMN